MALIAKSNGKDAPGSQASGEKVFLAAFGKHPGWDDHIEDLGLETDRLRETWRLLYTEGIGRNIASWSELPPAHRKERFSHLFVLAEERGAVVGRMWSSRDGKGRTFYPMVVCAECRGLSVEWAIARAMPLLADLEEQCRAAASAEDVRQLVEAARKRLRQEAAKPWPEGLPGISPSSSADLLEQLETEGEGRLGIHRILYRLALGLPARPGAPADPAWSLRLPRGTSSPDASMPPWLALLGRLLGPGTPILAIAPLDEPWLDLVVGPPSPEGLFCIRAALPVSPLVTKIAYTLESPFVEQADRLVDRLLAGESADLRALLPAMRPAERAVPARRTGLSLVARLAGVAEDLAQAVRSNRRTRRWLLALGVLFLLAAAALAVLAL